MRLVTIGGIAALASAAALAACSDQPNGGDPTGPLARNGLVEGARVRAQGTGTLSLMTARGMRSLAAKPWSSEGSVRGGIARAEGSRLAPRRVRRHERDAGPDRGGGRRSPNRLHRCEGSAAHDRLRLRSGRRAAARHADVRRRAAHHDGGVRMDGGPRRVAAPLGDAPRVPERCDDRSGERHGLGRGAGGGPRFRSRMPCVAWHRARSGCSDRASSRRRALPLA